MARDGPRRRGGPGRSRRRRPRPSLQPDANELAARSDVLTPGRPEGHRTKDEDMNKTWFITGTSRGFGRVWTEAALSRGDHVVATARDTTALDDLVAQHGE